MTVPVGTYFGYKTVLAFLDLNEEIEKNPGPPTYEGTADTINRAVVVTVGGGPGLILESIIDRVVVSVDCAGDQNDYDSAEALAMLVDRQILAIASAKTIDGIRVYGATRAGGRPTPVSVDDGDRWHLSCSYVWQVQSGV